MSDMKGRTYKDAINALNSLQSNFQSLEAKRLIGPSVDKNEYSIKTVYEFIRRLGYQPKDFNKLNVIHITGTKGKGSTCAFTESILLNYSYNKFPQGLKKIGLFTSPHLKSVRERIRINGQPIEELKFTKYFFEVWDKLSSTTSNLTEFPDLDPCDKVKPMYFKYLTLLSYHIFVSEGVDTAIYEVGVGGKYDSTNVIEKPTVTGISALGIDHVAMLGSTIESITWNKTGIFKSNVPAFVSNQLQYPTIHKFIEERAKELKVSKLEFINSNNLHDTPLGLLGAFQKDNAALAVKLAACHLKTLGITDDLPNDDLSYLPENFKLGLKNAKWDGRCQILSEKSNFPGITWFIDGAHTKESIDVASNWLKTSFTSSNPKVLIFNQQGRDTADQLLIELYNNLNHDIKFDYVIFCTNITWSTGYNSELVSMNNSKEAIDQLSVQKHFKSVWESLDKDNNTTTEVKVFKEIEKSLEFINSLEKPLDVFVCGSLHLVGGVLTVLDNERD